MAIQEALPPLLAYGRAHAPTFGGMHVDQAAGGLVHFAFTADVGVHQAALQRPLPAGGQLQVRQVAHSEAALDHLVDQISRDKELESALGITVHNTGTNIPDNSVEVVIEPYSPESRPQFRENTAAPSQS